VKASTVLTNNRGSRGNSISLQDQYVSAATNNRRSRTSSINLDPSTTNVQMQETINLLTRSGAENVKGDRTSLRRQSAKNSVNMMEGIQALAISGDDYAINVCYFE
jgi:hypothetical protein